jgi:Asp-tRNA(Asn)/Glu-tRNA(Gln) amidotransferase C subunit
MHQITPSTVEELAGLAGLPLPSERRAMLAAVLRQLLDGVHAMDALDLEEAEPPLVFDARWEE